MMYLHGLDTYARTLDYPSVKFIVGSLGLAWPTMNTISCDWASNNIEIGSGDVFSSVQK